MALHSAVTWAGELGYRSFEVESDSKTAVSLLSEVVGGRWRKTVEDLKRWSLDWSVSYRHVYREANWPAHLMSRYSVEGGDAISYFRATELPNSVRKSILADKLGLASIRYL
ncbi:unnamed protein product [Cuscuta epithymum]|uniref:RNase H type-1 domain-containing protein n=1 Tax=Cuscuta epithymum TaxID=186058 RepID=A0AAV0FBS9_9ASTE|nr:unnamed protein product [Cuscuta epithymum]